MKKVPISRYQGSIPAFIQALGWFLLLYANKEYAHALHFDCNATDDLGVHGL